MEDVVTDARAAWKGLESARILMTGGSGFVGLAMLEMLAAANRQLRLDASVVVLTRDPARFASRVPQLAAEPWLQTTGGDICSFDAPQGAFTHVIHGATETHPAATAEDRRRVFATIVDGTRRVLDAARRAKARRFLMLSTGAVYGPLPESLPRVTEAYQGAPDPLSPGRSGAEAKRAAEALCAIAAEPDFDVLIARPFAFVGPWLPLDMHYAVGNFIGDALKGGPIRVRGDGTPIRSYMYSADLAEWLWTILLRGVSLRPYNVGSERAISIADAAMAVARACGGCDVEIAKAAQPGAPVDRYVPSTARAREELHLRETVPFESALTRTVAWYRGPSHVAH